MSELTPTTVVPRGTGPAQQPARGSHTGAAPSSAARGSRAAPAPATASGVAAPAAAPAAARQTQRAPSSCTASSVCGSSCITTSTTAAKIRLLEQQLAEERGARDRAQRQLEDTARELDMMEKVVQARAK
eukprot:TRINITY_DN20473_c0_g1_i1.p3 TRINITY_DN20473_c0_g1~~TRINITY_DN20473_c0_g1_i1.p3  ORF type:complete len:130 (+),score=30.15 TRINITY_DN20473_c0_g1_i1:77-466(+)